MMFKTSSSIDLSTSVAQIMIDFDGVDISGDAISKSVKKLSKSWKIVKKPKKPQRSENVAKVIGLEKHLLKYQSSIN